MSEELKELISKWHRERVFYTHQAKKVQDSIKYLTKLNILIHEQCKIENIDIESLSLIPARTDNSALIKRYKKLGLSEWEIDVLINSK